MSLQRLRDALANLLQEFDQIVSEFDRLKRAYEPPYVAYASWSAPGARQILAEGTRDA